MKKVLSLALALVLALSLTVVSAGAQSAYTYKSFTMKDQNDDFYTFSAASTGYTLHSEVSGRKTRDILVILKPGSTVTVTKGDSFGLCESFHTWGVRGGIMVEGDVEGTGTVYDTRAVERIFDPHTVGHGYEIEDTLAFLRKRDSVVFFMMESAAVRHAGMITAEGEPAPQPEMDISIQFIDDDYDIDNGHVYRYTLTNNTDAPISKYAALVTYNPNLVKKSTYDKETNTFVVKDNAEQLFRGQIHAVDIDLAAGESVTMPMISSIYGLTSLSMLWIDFESLAERDDFLSDPIFGVVSVDDLQGYRAIDGQNGGDWMGDMLGVTINPAK